MTAVLLIPLMLGAILYLPPIPFLYFTGAIILAAGWEWTNLMELKQSGWRAAYLILMAFVGYAILFVTVLTLLRVTLIWWLLALALVVKYPSGSSWWGKGDLMRGLMGLLVLIPCWGAINFIRGQSDGVYILLFLLVLIWGADTAAYFAGKQWGKHKLLPKVSPGKSVEGIAAAVLILAG